MGCNTFSSSFPLAGINKPETRLFIIIELTKQEKKRKKKRETHLFSHHLSLSPLSPYSEKGNCWNDYTTVFLLPP